ncbi:MAG: tRNA-specific adenosine deaminase [Myxococcota bacterium]|nr:tRNA-specific adenosine deaminase [Myxococcota bacterium]
MQEALAEARKAEAMGETPVGAVVECGGAIIARAHNRRECDRNPFAHAEFLAMEQAAERLGRWRLTGCTVVVTLEPCPMCAGALVNARADRVAYGARDPRAGAVDSLYQITGDPRLNHRVEVVSGVREAECAELLRDFFRRLRGENKRRA